MKKINNNRNIQNKIFFNDKNKKKKKKNKLDGYTDEKNIFKLICNVS